MDKKHFANKLGKNASENLANVCQVVSDKNIKVQISKKGKLNKPTDCGFEENI